MSCLDVMYHQSYGAHYLPASSAAAAAAYKAAYYHHHHQQQQRKLCVYSKMQECVEQQEQHCPEGRQQHGRLPREQGLRRGPEAPGTGPDGGSASASASKDHGGQPAEAEYLNSRCVLFTYFHGDIGDVVDEHFSRALNQSGAFSGETKHIRTTQPPASATAGLWKEGVSLSEGQSGSLPSSSIWNSAYPSQASPCLPSVSVSVHPDFSPSPVPFHPPEGALWAGHALSQPSLPPPPALPDAWTYSLSPQSTAGYPHIHEVYPHPHAHPHMHMHARHPHAMLHSHPTQSPALNPRFSPLLLPGVRGQSQPVPSPGSHGSPHSEGIKTEMDPSSTSPIPATSSAWPPSALHGALDTYDSALDQDKVKSSGWF